MRKGETLQALAAARGLAATDVPGVQRGMPVPDAASVGSAIFEMPAPAAGKVSPGKVMLGDGRLAVFAVNKVTPGDAKAHRRNSARRCSSSWRRWRGTNDALGLVKALRKGLKITVAEERL